MFVVEVQGGHCGYLATLGALAGGASFFYIPEFGLNIRELVSNVEVLKKKYLQKNSVEGRVILRNEKCSQTYTTEFISEFLREEGQGVFDSRTANPGHLQQGGSPSPLDRIRGTRLANLTLHFIEDSSQKIINNNLINSEELSVVAGFVGGNMTLTPVQQLITQTDFKNRRPKNQWWLQLRELFVALSKGV